MLRHLYFGVSEQAKAGRHRLADARALFDAQRWRGAMYMAGYSVECLLKTKLMLKFDCDHLLELDDELQRRGVLGVRGGVFTHQFETLLRLNNGLDRLRRNRECWLLFNVVNQWVPAWRYCPDLSNRVDAVDFLEAVDGVLHWVETNT